MRTQAEAEANFWKRVERTEGCWLWTGSLTSKGYGIMHLWRGYYGSIRAHRFAYELLVGPIPDDRQIDHLCRNRACVNPDHLDVVTSRENTLRGNAAKRKELCKRGHRLDHSSGIGICRECRRTAQRKRRLARMSQVGHRS